MNFGKYSVAAAVLMAAQAAATSHDIDYDKKEVVNVAEGSYSNRDRKVVDFGPEKDLHHGCPHVVGALGLCN